MKEEKKEEIGQELKEDELDQATGGMGGWHLESYIN